MSELIAMSIKGLMLDTVSNSPIVVLKDDDEKFFLPIWVGIFEANAIALELEKIATPRPMTHDLIKNILETIEARVLKVVVTDLRDNTFFAVLHIQVGGTEYTVDSRPSDAIALAIRAEAPIFAADEVIEESAIEFEGEEVNEEEMVDEFKKFLDQVSPEQFAFEGEEEEERDA